MALAIHVSQQDFNRLSKIRPDLAQKIKDQTLTYDDIKIMKYQSKVFQRMTPDNSYYQLGLIFKKIFAQVPYQKR